MKRTLLITKMPTGITFRKEFITEADAKEYFYQFCDDNNIPYKSSDFEAGGVGYDYRIEIEEDQSSAEIPYTDGIVKKYYDESNIITKYVCGYKYNSEPSDLRSPYKIVSNGKRRTDG